VVIGGRFLDTRGRLGSESCSHVRDSRPSAAIALSAFPRAVVCHLGFGAATDPERARERQSRASRSRIAPYSTSSSFHRSRPSIPPATVST